MIWIAILFSIVAKTWSRLGTAGNGQKAIKLLVRFPNCYECCPEAIGLGKLTIKHLVRSLIIPTIPICHQCFKRQLQRKSTKVVALLGIKGEIIATITAGLIAFMPPCMTNMALPTLDQDMGRVLVTGLLLLPLMVLLLGKEAEGCKLPKTNPNAIPAMRLSHHQNQVSQAIIPVFSSQLTPSNLTTINLPTINSQLILSHQIMPSSLPKLQLLHCTMCTLGSMLCLPRNRTS